MIIEAALNGINPRAPRDPDGIARDALACLEAGAAILHNHIDTPGRSTGARRRPPAKKSPSATCSPGGRCSPNARTR
ncbi:3-keto-5-aminohexanoate cleavage protein [Yinghuangia aomiensis]